MSSQQNSQIASTQITPDAATEAAMNEGAPIGFFAVGLVINLVVIAAFGAWAWRNWRKPGDKNRS